LIVGCSKANNEAKDNNFDPNQVIKIKDAGLEKIIRDNIEKPEGDILASDMGQLYSLNINFKETPVHELDGLEYATKLHDFSIRYGKSIKSLDPISYIKTLVYLNVSNTDVDNKPSTFNTPSLERVNFITTNIKDYGFLKTVNKMTNLDITDNDVTSISFVANMNDLITLDLNYNKVSDISSLKNKKKLVEVYMHQNQVKDISVLATCVKLEKVNISYNHVSNIKPPLGLKNLIELTAKKS